MQQPSLDEKLKLASAMFGGTTAKAASAPRLSGITAHVLYEDETGTTGTVTLSDSAANYTFLDVICSTDEGRQSGTTRVYKPNGKAFEVSVGLVGANGYHSIWFGRYSVSGNTITPILNYRWGAAFNGTEQLDENTLNIITVIGYR